MLLTERFPYFQCKNMFTDFLILLSKSFSFKIQGNKTNLSVTNIWEPAEIHYNHESFQHLAMSHPSWYSFTLKNTKFSIYMVWGCINYIVWVSYPFFARDMVKSIYISHSQALQAANWSIIIQKLASKLGFCRHTFCGLAVDTKLEILLETGSRRSTPQVPGE